MKNFELKTITQRPDVEGLVNLLHRNYPKANYNAVYEAGFSGYWAQRKLLELGVNCILTHLAEIPTSDKEQYRKSDPVDC